uniref:Uncharacterized protein n=1 Tax=Cacopsylla melanoneura TaxID=428564 RepID=A0A8D8Y639_9HEMI
MSKKGLLVTLTSSFLILSRAIFPRFKIRPHNNSASFWNNRTIQYFSPSRAVYNVLNKWLLGIIHFYTTQVVGSIVGLSFSLSPIHLKDSKPGPPQVHTPLKFQILFKIQKPHSTYAGHKLSSLTKGKTVQFFLLFF